MQLIFIVQGESEVGQIMRSYLGGANYAVRLFTRVIDAVAESRLRPALICMEIGADTGVGLEPYGLIRRVPALANTPVILFSTEATDEDRILALESGADDYVTRPFTAREFIARVQAVLRRYSQSYSHSDVFPAGSYGLPSSSEGLPPEIISMGDIQIDTLAMKVSVRGLEVITTALEFRLMYYLAKHQYRVFTRDQLLDAVWGDKQFVTPRSVDACIRRIRRKIEPDRNKPTYLKTVRGAGYLLDVSGAADICPEPAMLSTGLQN